MDDRYGYDDDDDDDDSVYVKYMAWHSIWCSRERKIDRQTDICEFTYRYRYRYIYIYIHTHTHKHTHQNNTTNKHTHQINAIKSQQFYHI